MDVFEFRNEIIDEYQKFSRSFAKIRTDDIRQAVDKANRAGHFWPAPLIQLNPNFAHGGYVDELVKDRILQDECRKIFRLKRRENVQGESLRLHRHQADAIKIAMRNESFVLTTGTGSGKSLAYFIPIVDAVLRAKRFRGGNNGISAIVVYPMNALCNSQREELEKYLSLGFPVGEQLVSFARYTGQEGQDERDRIANNPPDILLTNYMMLELIMTRFQHTDIAIRQHAAGLRFLVLDELHTYRGRQGADVSMLVRRVRERFNDKLLCIGTSATLASEGSLRERREKIADVAGRLFGATVKPENVVSETLRCVTDPANGQNKAALRNAIERGVANNMTHDELRVHPVASWVEHQLGLTTIEGTIVRNPKPPSILEASKRLAEQTSVDLNLCEVYLTNFLLAAHQSRNAQGQSFFAFRLHQFISGAWNIYTTIQAEGERYLTLNGQQFQPGHRDRLLFPLAFCRSCGQEYLPVWANLSGKIPRSFEPRDITERSNDEANVIFGYLMPDPKGIFSVDDVEASFPEDWLDFGGERPKLKPYYRKFAPMPTNVNTNGEVDQSGLNTWFIPESFRFCLNPECNACFSGNVRSDLTKLSGLSSEGRSSATTILTLASLKHLIGTNLDARTKKLLAFTDNRQDASLQAGHFNDFIQILLLRGALLASIQADIGTPVEDDNLTHGVFNHLSLDVRDYSVNPTVKGHKAKLAERTLRDVLGYRLYFDLKRGWRITSPNLEQLNLLEIHYMGLDDCCADEEEWQSCHPLLGSLSPQRRFTLLKDLLDRMRRSLCIKTLFLDPDYQERLRNRSFNQLSEPWGLSDDERLSPCLHMIPRPGGKSNPRNFDILNISHKSAFGRDLKLRSTWGEDNSHYPAKFDEQTFNSIIDDMLTVLSNYGLVVTDETTGKEKHAVYRIDSSVLSWRLGRDQIQKDNPANVFFRDLYLNVARMLGSDDRLLHQLEAREHTAQVENTQREDRELRFRKGLEDGGLPVLFCSPTMELGVDISSLNAVYMRNTPPTPANYAQRSGRAGRSGQPALVITYCAAKSPHDQYFFAHPENMVAGAVNPPNIDLANEELIRSHLQAVWLVETGAKLEKSVRHLLDLNEVDGLPLVSDLAEQITRDKSVQNALKRGARILSTLEHDLHEFAPWYTSSWLDAAMTSAERRFDKSFDRWRSLYLATDSQMKRANSVIENAASSEQQSKEAKARYDAAFNQKALIVSEHPSWNSDFYTYRYLAAQGFLPGYNFPRLPLLAYVPAQRTVNSNKTFLSRPRFLGLSEFGPQSIIYHEGNTYRVRRAILAISEEADVRTTHKLPVQNARICPACGYGHFNDQRNDERCTVCNTLLEGGTVIHNLHKIEQVSTKRASRITSDEEERQRQGYEMITTLRFSEENGKRRCIEKTVEQGGDKLIELRYAPSATLWRINLGWRRRKEKSIYGFSIDTQTGEWSKDSQAPVDAEDDSVIVGKATQRITPFVEDTRNILVIRPSVKLDELAMVSLQYALKRGIEQVFQLEDSELAAEPLPDRESRNNILFYESAEGGAGVLTRIANDSTAIGKIARKAIEICHYQSKSGKFTGFDDLEDQFSNCEAGCYRCLLSYYNQLDHQKIDRRNEVMLNLLCRLVNGKPRGGLTSAGDLFQQLLNSCESTLEKAWLEWIRDKGYRLPDAGQKYLESLQTRPDFVYSDFQTLVYIDGPHHRTKRQKSLDEVITERLENAGYTVIRFNEHLSEWSNVIGEYAWVFGTGDTPAVDNS